MDTEKCRVTRRERSHLGRARESAPRESERERVIEVLISNITVMQREYLREREIKRVREREILREIDRWGCQDEGMAWM